MTGTIRVVLPGGCLLRSSLSMSIDPSAMQSDEGWPLRLQSLFVVGTLLLLITLVINVLGKLVVSRISETIA